MTETKTPATTMTAAVLVDWGRVEIQEVPVPQLEPDEVLLRVHSTAICGTDPHIIEGRFKGRWPRAFPFILGHEFSGTVVAVAERAAAMGWQEGDRVAGTSHSGCGTCRMCRIGRYNLCDNYGNRRAGHRQYGHYVDGSYAQLMAVSVRSVYKIPDEMSLEQASQVDGTSIALHSLKRGHIKPADVVAIIGPGPMGLQTYLCAKALGAARVFVIGYGDRLKRAADLGAETVDSQAADPGPAIRQLNDGRGADLVVDCAGVTESVKQSLDVVGKGGRAVLTGIPGEEVGLHLRRLVLEEIDIYGVRANAGNDMDQTIALIASGAVPVEKLITHRFPLKEFKAAYDIFVSRKEGALKILVQP